jgi:F-type H+-transporting ATPase subunit delta
MNISKQARREAKQLFRSCFVNGALAEKRVRDVVTKIIELKPRGYMGILAQMQRLVKLEIDRRTARVESATALAADQQVKVKSALAALYGPGLEIGFAQSPGLLGGLRVKVGSDVYDGSVQARLERLQESF